MTDRWTFEQSRTADRRPYRIVLNDHSGQTVGPEWCDELIIRHRQQHGQVYMNDRLFDAIVALIERDQNRSPVPCGLPVGGGYRCTREAGHPTHGVGCEWRTTSPHADRFRLGDDTDTADAQRLAAVRALHPKRSTPIADVAAEHVYCGECRQTWPCATIQATGESAP